MTSISPDALVTTGFRLGLGRILTIEEQGELDIESVFLQAVQEIPKDRRMAGVLLAWVKVHGQYVIVEKLGKLSRNPPGDQVPADLTWLPAVARWAVECGFSKWRRIIQKPLRPTLLYSPEVTASAIARKGEVPWLADVGFQVPKGSIRIREEDVMTPEELVKVNQQYRNRYLYGPNWRADIITAIESGLTSPTQIMRRVGCSYEPAHRVWREWQIASAA